MTTRKEFFQQLEPFHVPSDLLRIEWAYTLAKFSHRAQVRKEKDADGKPVRYFEHVRRVALLVMEAGFVDDADMVIAALLHDGLEDTRDITTAMLEHSFGKEVTKLVKVLSKVPSEGYLERFHLCTDFRAYVIKACDRLDNLRHLGSTSIAFQKKQIAETKDKYYDLFRRMRDLAPKSHIGRVCDLFLLILKAVDEHKFTDPVLVEPPASNDKPPLPTYHELLDKLCVEFKVPGSPDFDQAVQYIKTGKPF